MSKKPKAAAKAKGGGKVKGKKSGAQRKPQEAAQIGVNDFTNLVRRCKSLKTQAQTTAGEIGEMVKNAVENKNLDRVAFAIFRRLEAMADTKLATTLACLDYYIEIGGLEKRIEDAPPLPIARQEAGEKEDGPEPADKVVPLRAAE